MRFPEPVLLYSHINLPATNILSRAQLGLIPFNYRSFMNEGTPIDVEDVESGQIDARDPDPDKYLSGITALLFEGQDTGCGRTNRYRQCAPDRWDVSGTKCCRMARGAVPRPDQLRRSCRDTRGFGRQRARLRRAGVGTEHAPAGLRHLGRILTDRQP